MMSRRETLTAKQSAFVRGYLIDFNATRAAIRAGYSLRSAGEIGRQLLGKTGVSAAIEKSTAERSRRTGLCADRVLQELGRHLRIFTKRHTEEMPAVFLMGEERIEYDGCRDSNA